MCGDLAASKNGGNPMNSIDIVDLAILVFSSTFLIGGVVASREEKMGAAWTLVGLAVIGMSLAGLDLAALQQRMDIVGFVIDGFRTLHDKGLVKEAVLGPLLSTFFLGGIACIFNGLAKLSGEARERKQRSRYLTDMLSRP